MDSCQSAQGPPLVLSADDTPWLRTMDYVDSYQELQTTSASPNEVDEVLKYINKTRVSP